jgi:putative membrane protein
MDAVQINLLADSWGMHGDIGTGWWIVMMIGMVFFWGAIILGVVWLIRSGFDSRQGPGRESPTEILDRRFAEGVITLEDYRARRNILVNGSAETNGAVNDEVLMAP